jgi:hypothetical protein
LGLCLEVRWKERSVGARLRSEVERKIRLFGKSDPLDAHDS